MQTNSDLIKNMGILAEEVYDNDNFLVGEPINADGIIYTVVATSDMSSGFQGLLLENNGKYVFAFRGTETESGVFEFWRDLAITDIRDMGTGTAPQQMKDAMSFVHEMRNQYSGINATNTTFTGHSLGGSLAGMASYVYGFDAYTYNGFGINNMLWDADDTGAVDHPREMTPDEFGMSDTYQTLGEHLESLGVIVQGTTSRTNNIIHVGYAHSDIIGGILTDIISGQIGDTHFVVNHTGDSGGGLDNHDKVKLNESIAIYNNILTLFPDQDYNSLTEILTPISPEDQKIESFLSSLGEVVSAEVDSDHVTWSENISGTGIANLTLTSLTDTSAASLEAQASNPAHLYALLKLNPFAITGTNYSHLNQNGELDSDNYSEQFIEDRALFLYALTHPDETHFTEYDTGFVDDALNISADVEGSTVASGSVPNIFEWGNGEDPINGGGGDDHLYGTYLNDVIDGSDGDDYIEGGLGQDTQKTTDFTQKVAA